MKLANKSSILVTALVVALSIALPTTSMAKGTKKTSVSSVTQIAPKPTPKPVAPKPALYSGTDYDNVLGLGNYFVTK